MVAAKLYVEGAGPRRAQQSQARRAFANFFASAGVQNRPRVEPCGGRQAAFDSFCIAVQTGDPAALPLLLVDAEGSVAEDDSVWQHLKARDGWDAPAGVQRDQAFLMVQVMESWFLADPAALHRRFGPRFSEAPFRAWRALEAVPKQTVYEVLERATADCKQTYRKGDVSFELLGDLDPARVEAACPHARELLERLRNLG
jgi:hypothetical protein